MLPLYLHDCDCVTVQLGCLTGYALVFKSNDPELIYDLQSYKQNSQDQLASHECHSGIKSFDDCSCN